MDRTRDSVRINFVAGRSRRLFGCFFLLSLFFVFSFWEFGCFFAVLERKPICYWVFPFLFLLVRFDTRTGWQRRLAWGVIPHLSSEIAISCTFSISVER